METSGKTEITEPVGWSVSVDFLESLIESCRRAGLDSTVVVVREKDSDKMVDSSTHDLYFRGAGPQIVSTWLLSSQIDEIWFDEFPPIPPGP